MSEYKTEVENLSEYAIPLECITIKNEIFTIGKRCEICNNYYSVTMCDTSRICPECKERLRKLLYKE